VPDKFMVRGFYQLEEAVSKGFKPWSRGCRKGKKRMGFLSMT